MTGDHKKREPGSWVNNVILSILLMVLCKTTFQMSQFFSPDILFVKSFNILTYPKQGFKTLKFLSKYMPNYIHKKYVWLKTYVW